MHISRCTPSDRTVNDLTDRKRVISIKQDAEFFHRIGIRYADRMNYGRALKFILKAVQLEPGNPDFQFNLAGVYAEIGELQKSNEVLFQILKKIDSNLTECYFGIGCNFFDMGDFPKSKEYFQRYVLQEPEGLLADEVYDALYYLGMMEGEAVELQGIQPKQGKVPARVRQSDAPGVIRLERRYGDILKCALSKGEGTYDASYRKDLRRLIKEVVSRAYPGGWPVIRKPEVWAAAMEYIYCRSRDIPVTVKALSEKYGVTAVAINNRVKNLFPS